MKKDFLCIIRKIEIRHYEQLRKEEYLGIFGLGTLAQKKEEIILNGTLSNGFIE